MAETIQQQLQQLVLIPETSTKKISNVNLASESWHSGGLGLFRGQNEDIIEQLGPIIQSVYRTGKEDLFKKQVDLFAAKKDAEILKLCGDHQQQFFESLGQLLRVRQNTSELQEKVVDLNSDLQRSGKSLLESKKQLLELKKKHRNIELALAETKKHNEVVYMISGFEQLIQEKNYYEAIKTLEEVQQAYIQRVKNFKLGAVMADSFPLMATDLKNASLSDMREWLYGLKKNMREIGGYLTNKMSKRQKMWSIRDSKIKERNYVSPAVQFVLDEESEDEDLLKVNLKPLYMCLYVHNKLGFQAEFSKNYSNDRKAQINLIMTPGSNLFSNDMIPFEDLIYDIIGFFIIENNVILSAPDFRSKTDVDVLWDFVVDSFSTIIAQNIQEILKSEDSARDIKNILISFIFVMEEYSFDVQKLRELVSAIFSS
ncbi:hypothetical protein BB559_003144 [Furculomyces boomerangus]|uniref:Exocyst complex component EXOC6/Sec15 N-terminal domain-containing protein n=2 Tax=Harpellales TaxID=61421 RepID=A0A2T9YNG1_9FUNG|nr:hypothetical protein BB559_003144 [Furculomyces boomerangus]PWA03429.1 hypothetical protein BB558_000398 [Smittium angustum]